MFIIFISYMGEIMDFYLEFERNLNSFEEIASYKIVDTENIENKSEKRTYEVYPKENVDMENLKNSIEDRMRVAEVNIKDEKLIVKANYDKSLGPTSI